MEKSEQPLWNRERKQLAPKTDIFHSEIESLQATLKNAKKFKLLKKRDDGNIYTTIESYDQKNPRENSSKKSATKAEAHIKDGTGAIFLAVNTYDKASDTRIDHYYQALENGVVIDLDMDMTPVDRVSEDYTIVVNALTALQNGIDIDVRIKRSDIEHRRRVFRNIGVTAASIAAAGGVIAFGIDKLFIEPAAVDEAYRNTYDHTVHTLPGSGTVIESHSFGLVSQPSFNAIPTYGGNDHNFLQPRLESLDINTGCVEVTTSVHDGKTLYAAVPNTSVIKYDHYNVSRTDDGFEVCLAETVPDQVSTGDLDVAIQIR